MRVSTCIVLGLGLALGSLTTSARAVPGKVAIYTGATVWIDPASASEQAQICADRLNAAGIPTTVFSSTDEDLALAEWLTLATSDGELDVLVLYGYFPASIYPEANRTPNGSIAELFIESADGDAILNHGDWMFYVSIVNNGTAGLQNMMDIPGITMGPDNTPVVVTDQGRAIAPSLEDFLSDRSFHLDELAGDWFVEASLAQNEAGTRADPVIVRDGTRGRLIPVYQTENQMDPKGAVAAEIIAWLMEVDLQPTEVALVGSTTTLTGISLTIQAVLQDASGIPTAAPSSVTLDLATDSATGAFDVVRTGAFDGAVTSVTIPEGTVSTTLYYRDSSPLVATLTATPSGVPGLSGGSLAVNVKESRPVSQGDVAIYTGRVMWIDKGSADAQAQICVDKLDALGIPSVWFTDSADEDALSDWMAMATDDGELDVLVLYGLLPASIYPSGNTMPDGSLAELFIESPDGDLIINHADYMFYDSYPVHNREAALEHMMDIPGIGMWGDNTPMTVTPEGKAIAPSLSDFLTDRPFHVDELAGDWFVEVSLAQNDSGTRADPIVVRDGNRGRLAPVFQTASQADPKGAVAAEIIAWLMESTIDHGHAPFRRGDADADGLLNITDGIYIMRYLFLGGSEPPCLEAANADDDAMITVEDGVYILNYLFLPSPAPTEPGPNGCGPDPIDSESDLGCDHYTGC